MLSNKQDRYHIYIQLWIYIYTVLMNSKREGVVKAQWLLLVEEEEKIYWACLYLYSAIITNDGESEEIIMCCRA